MKLDPIHQIKLNELPISFDVAITASGFESRAAHVAGLIRDSRRTCNKNIALAFKDRKILSRPRNDELFISLGYDLVECSGSEGYTLTSILDQIFKSDTVGSEPCLLIDYSCMTRIWYAAILEFFAHHSLKYKKINLFFTYSVPKFYKPEGVIHNIHMGPIPGFCNLQMPDQQTVLIVGLGTDPDRALGLHAYVDAKQTYAFYTEPAADPKFSEAVRDSNIEFLKRIGPERQLSYPFNDLLTTDAILSSVCRGFSSQYRVILAPLGPKPFSLHCLLLALRFAQLGLELDVWRVSSGSAQKPADREPHGEVLCYHIQFTNDEP